MASLDKNADAPRSPPGVKGALDMLLFTLGAQQEPARGTFGIDVLEVREVMRTPPVTPALEAAAALEGVVSLRGTLMPVIDLARYAGIACAGRAGVMIVAENGEHRLGLLVGSVDVISRVERSAIQAPSCMMDSRAGGLVSGVTQLRDGRLVMMMDAGAIIAQVRARAMSAGVDDGVRGLGRQSPAGAVCARQA